MTEQETFRVQDETGREYILSGKTWTGGQGKVCVDQTGRFIIKLTNKRNDLSREKIRQQFRKIRQLPLDGLPITRPLALLRAPYVGYVMEYLTGMEPIASIMYPPDDCLDIGEWYQKTGGLKRRLEILIKLANILKRLRGKGLVYGDISPNNIFISESSEHTEVYLIDIDNLTYETNTASSMIKTHPFGAPEVVLGKHGIDTLTDVYSFAVIVFITLSLGHPLFGDQVIDGEPELEEKAVAGEFPWIFHTTDESNRSSHVLPKEIVFSKKLFELFEITFTDGLLDRSKRPGISKWEERLSTALQFVLVCPRCKGSYFRDSSTCPWCNASRPPYLLAIVDVYSPNAENTLELFKKAESGYCIQYPGNVAITRRILGYHDDEAERLVIELNIDANLLVKIRSLDGKEYFATHAEWSYEQGTENGGRREKIDRSWKSLRTNWRIHLGSFDKTHLVIRFSEISR